MRITVRLIVSLVFVAALVAYLSSYLQVQNERESLTRDLDIRASVLAESLQESVESFIRLSSPDKLKRFVEQFEGREKLLGVAVYDTHNVSLTTSKSPLTLVASTALPIVGNHRSK